jgi:hypothetical protein
MFWKMRLVLRLLRSVIYDDVSDIFYNVTDTNSYVQVHNKFCFILRHFRTVSLYYDKYYGLEPYSFKSFDDFFVDHEFSAVSNGISSISVL